MTKQMEDGQRLPDDPGQIFPGGQVHRGLAADGGIHSMKAT